jgi:hypothetical protein
MTWTDTWLLAKTILVGIVITLVPLAILAAGLWLTHRLAGNHADAKHADAKHAYAKHASPKQGSSTKVVTYAN